MTPLLIAALVVAGSPAVVLAEEPVGGIETVQAELLREQYLNLLRSHADGLSEAELTEEMNQHLAQKLQQQKREQYRSPVETIVISIVIAAVIATAIERANEPDQAGVEREEIDHVKVLRASYVEAAMRRAEKLSDEQLKEAIKKLQKRQAELKELRSTQRSDRCPLLA